MHTNETLEQDFLVDEMGKLRDEAEGLRRALERKIQQKSQAETEGVVEMERMKTLLDSSYEKLSESLEDMEVAICDSVDRSKKEIGKLIEGSENRVEDIFTDFSSSLMNRMNGIKEDVSHSLDSLDEMKDVLERMDQKLEEKANKNAVNHLHRRMTTMFVINIAGLGGTLMTMALLCYLILVMAR